MCAFGLCCACQVAVALGVLQCVLLGNALMPLHLYHSP